MTEYPKEWVLREAYKRLDALIAPPIEKPDPLQECLREAVNLDFSATSIAAFRLALAKRGLEVCEIDEGSGS